MKPDDLEEPFNNLRSVGWVIPSEKPVKFAQDKISFLIPLLNFMGDNPENEIIQRNGTNIINYVFTEVPVNTVLRYFVAIFSKNSKNLTPQGWMILLKTVFSKNTYDNINVLLPTVILRQFPDALFVRFLTEPGYKKIISNDWFWFIGKYYADSPMFQHITEEQIAELMKTGKIFSPVSELLFDFNNDILNKKKGLEIG